LAFFDNKGYITMIALSFSGALIITTILGFLGLLDVYDSKGA